MRKQSIEDLKRRVNELITSASFMERHQNYSAVYDNQQIDDDYTPVFGHSLSSFQLDNVRSRVESSKKTESLGKLLKKLAAKNGHFNYDQVFFGQAQFSKEYWSKISNDKMLNPGKDTILRFAILFKCDPEKTHELLAKAGYAFSDTKEREQLIMGCIEMGVYDFSDIEELLEEFGVKLLLPSPDNM